MKLKFYLEMFALIVGFVAVVVFTICLIIYYKFSIIFFENNLYLRISEIVIGCISAPILATMILKKLKQEVVK